MDELKPLANIGKLSCRTADFAPTVKYEMQFSEAFCTAEESDYQRDLLDRKLKQIFKKNFFPFEERYPRVKEIRYR